MSFKQSAIILAAAAVALGSCGRKTSGQAAGTAPEQPVKKVTVEAAAFSEVPQDETYSATVQAYAVNNVVPQSGGRIRKINVEVGDYVYAGQVLAEMDRLNLDQARLKLVNDSTELSRVRDLYKQGGVSQSDYEQLELAYNVSKSTYDNLVENTVLRSPLSGVVTARNYDRGDMYGMASPIFVVQQITPVKILVGISEKDYTRIHRGDKVTLTVDAIPGRVFEGKVNRLHPVMDASTHTFNVEVVVQNSDRALRPGMYARVNVVFEVRRSIVVSDTAVLKQQGSGQKAVYLYGEDGTARYTVVTLGRHFDGRYEILSGLNEGDRVIVSGNSGLKNGDKVEL